MSHIGHGFCKILRTPMKFHVMGIISITNFSYDFQMLSMMKGITTNEKTMALSKEQDI